MENFREILSKAVIGFASIGFLLLMVSFMIRVGTAMPDYALVYLDDDAHTYLAPFCIEEWQTRPSETFAFLRAGTAGEAHQLDYDPDTVCRDTGAFTGEDQSFFRAILESAGVVEPITQWWDAPYRKEDGTIVYPGQ